MDKGDKEQNKQGTNKKGTDKRETDKADIKNWKEERKRNYKQVIFELERPIFEKFKVRCAKDNLTQRAVLTQLLERYLNQGLKEL